MNKHSLTNIAMLVFTLFFCAAAHAATYYIDFENGDDRNDGLSREASWKTIPGSRNVDNSGWQQSCWGPLGRYTIDDNHSILPGTVFKLKGGTIYDATKGGYILIDTSFYPRTGATQSNPISFEADPSWGSGSVVFDGSGMTIPEALIIIRQIDGVKFDGIYERGITIENSPLTGIRYKATSHNTPVKDPIVRYIYFYNNGRSIPGDNGSKAAGLHLRNTVGGEVSRCEFNGNNQYVIGFMGGESHESATQITVSDCIAYNHKGELDPNDTGIGFFGANCDITFKNITSFNNLKGFDLGETNGDNKDIAYRVLNAQVYGNEWGINLNSVADKNYTGKVNFYIINSLIRNNRTRGSTIYSGPFNLYVVHNVYANNGDETGKDRGNIRINPGGGTDEAKINAYVYNNIFYKPRALKYPCNLQVGYVGDASSGHDTDFSLDSDYNSWVQYSNEPFAYWSFNLAPARTFYYGSNGPGHSSGDWLSDEDEPGEGSGHKGNDAHSKGTGADDPALPPLKNESTNDFTLTAHYQGLDLTCCPWYVPEMGIDRNGNQRTSWDIGAYEFTIFYGDVSGDGKISAYDAALAVQQSVGLISLNPEQITRADVTNDGDVSAHDASLIARKAAGLIAKFPVEE